MFKICPQVGLKISPQLRSGAFTDFVECPHQVFIGGSARYPLQCNHCRGKIIETATVKDFDCREKVLPIRVVEMIV